MPVAHKGEWRPNGERASKTTKAAKTKKEVCFGMGRKGSAGVQGVAHGVLPAMRA